ncbi:hypothetical protein OCU04_006110 [Sclerotinia nivalis]|uniref:Uncharacterized protein n=1 Tax=Sclerotinia nivalis TaxID=352851 RepID=A0A9X0AN67_9HELO|nr:hypothetical protein OCU04_006110 [Sclerotinia nivalis]
MSDQKVTVASAKELTSEDKVKLMKWLVQTDPVLEFVSGIVAKCREDSAFQRFIRLSKKKQKPTTSRKWVVKFYKRIWNEGNLVGATPQQMEFRRMIETCEIRRRGANIRDIEIKNLLKPKGRKLWVPNTIDTSEYAEGSEIDGGEGGNEGDRVDRDDKDNRSGEDNGNDGTQREDIGEEQTGNKVENSAEVEKESQSIEGHSPKTKKHRCRSSGVSNENSGDEPMESAGSGMDVTPKKISKGVKERTRKKRRRRDETDSGVINSPQRKS